MTDFTSELAGRELTIALPSGRRLGVREYGAPGGHPWILLHGTPGSRLMFAPAHDVASALGLRLICPDRPGIGLSTRHPGRTLTSFSADILALADQLGLATIPVFGVSGGAPYAVAAAACLGKRISRLALVSPMGPVADLHGVVPVHWGHRLFFRGLGQQAWLTRPFATLSTRLFFRDPARFLRRFAQALGEPDRTTLLRPAVMTHVERDLREALRQGIDAPLEDFALFGRPWDVDLGAVRQPVRMWQGTADTVVPLGVALGLARALPHVELDTLPGAGHFWIYDNIRPVLSALRDLSP